MRPSFLPRLINGPFGDPALFIPFQFEKRAFLFDVGDVSSLSARDILKITHVFVSHTHIDHFYGFDRLIRIMIGREKELFLYGPEGIRKNVQGKLNGYTWNLTGTFEHPFVIHVTEVTEEDVAVYTFTSENRFESPEKKCSAPFDGILLDTPVIRVKCAVLDHKIPCLAFSLKERFHVNIKKTALNELGLKTGPWLARFKESLYKQTPFETLINVPGEECHIYTLRELADKIALVTPGQKIGYITDTVFNETVLAKATALCKEADHLFIEAAFSHEDASMADEKHHLTTVRAADIAKAAGAKQMTLFHFSPRYQGRERIIMEEAEKRFSGLS